MERNRRQLRFYVATLGIVFIMLQAGDLGAQTDPTHGRKNRFGLSTVVGNTYDPVNDIAFVLLNGFALLDRERLCGYKIPEWFRLKVEGNLGSTITPYKKLMASADVLALFYLKSLCFNTLRLYAEGGAGVVYTDFQIKGQGLRFNFDPLFGIGSEIKTASGAVYLITLRIQHFSNGSLNHENAGLNSLSLVVGKFF
jgi:lipid A 3-O-deacylase